MFNNIGKKIMKFAKVMCWIVIILGIIVSIASAYEMARVNTILVGIVVFIPSVVLTVFLGWASFLVLYGFGQLVDDTHEIKSAVVKPEEEKAE